jgi:deazaflavin-dependent oxidoreductase (nitroreductase family)
MTWRQNLVDVGFKTMNISHRAVRRVRGGHALSSAFGMPAVELSVVGRKSGLRRTTLLTAPILDDSRVVLVASKGGDDRNPEWYCNLLANPNVEITVLPTGEVRPLRARVASPEETEELWPKIVGAYQGYERYQKRTHRDIPVVICEPRPA